MNIYIDANHQYEYVLRELLEWSSLVSDEGFIQLNDCVYSDKGSLQNLGVLSALREFLMRNDEWRPLAQSTGDFADVVLCRKGTGAEKKFADVIENSKAIYIDIPDNLLFSSKCKKNRMIYV